MSSVMNLNTQPISKQVSVGESAGILAIKEVFHTIQGEGPFAGCPAIFLRLAGCNLQCPLCDTDYSSSPTYRHYVDVPGWIEGMVRPGCRRPKLVVITGGEPFRQPLGPLIRLLLESRFQVQIETNGTLYDDSMEELFSHRDIHIVCSPKTPKIDQWLVPHISAYKYVLSTGAIDLKDGLPTGVLGLNCAPARPHFGFVGDTFVQPADEGDAEKNKKNLQACVHSALRFGYRLSIQTHKIANLP